MNGKSITVIGSLILGFDFWSVEKVSLDAGCHRFVAGGASADGLM